MTSITDQRTDIRRTDDQPPAPGTPWWVALIYKYGLWAALACFLVYNLVSGQAATITHIDATVSAHERESTASGAARQDWETRMEVYQRLLCVNTAQTDDARRSCLTVR